MPERLFPSEMYSLEIRSAVLGPQNLQDSLLNSLLAGNLGRERLAPDCLHRHSVWVAEKLSCITARIAENRGNSVGLAFKPHWRKCRVEPRCQVFWRFSLDGICAVRFH
jgi:hypothetical protein